MSNKGKSILTLVMLVFLVSLACNLPHAESQFGQRIICLLTGGTWVEYPDGVFGMCVKEPSTDEEKPASEEIDTSDEDSPQMDENPIQEEVIEPPAEEVLAPESTQPSITAPTEEPTDGEVTSDDIIGTWTGTWKIQDEYNPPWEAIFTFNADGTFTATMSSSLGKLDYYGNWSLVEDKIDLVALYPYNYIWTGSVNENFMSGTDDYQNAVWSLTKQE